MPRRTTPAIPPAQLAQLRAETEAARDRIWARWQAWERELVGIPFGGQFRATRALPVRS
jgi:hypothetical protein